MPNYGDSQYWDDRYAEEDTSFDWYLSYPQLKEVLTPHLQPLRDDNSLRILNIGCGNSRLSVQMSEDGLRNISSIDISSVVIDQMKARHPDLEWQQMDCMKLDFPSNHFHFVVDKGTLDALLCGQDSFENALAMNKEVYRVLAPGGTYVNITYGQPSNRLNHLEQPFFKWSVESLQVDRAYALPKGTTTPKAAGSYYVYIMTKPAAPKAILDDEPAEGEAEAPAPAPEKSEATEAPAPAPEAAPEADALEDMPPPVPAESQ
eukprot:gnl/Trimastix_PCT/711.p1 GENE.gnl/Trimastix_PCT/711~~gnl/Trimastix_PCT/711.p1  ORF type:complete len:261 (-),score=88.79 gnl/Trimastix_PCT/711:51-833(-)